jgi:hypothetical protein
MVRLLVVVAPDTLEMLSARAPPPPGALPVPASEYESMATCCTRRSGNATAATTAPALPKVWVWPAVGPLAEVAEAGVRAEAGSELLPA